MCDAPQTITLNGASVAVSAVAQTPPLDVTKALSSTPFKRWASELDPRFAVTTLTFQSLDMFGPRVGFVKFLASGTFQGFPVPGIVFARGGAVAILPVLTCEGTQWVVCCRQPRLPIGRHFLEIPAGMLDDSGSFVGVAAKEMQEETGIAITEADLVDLTGLAYGEGTVAGPGGGEAAAAGGPLHGMYPSVGGCDEFIRIFYFSKVVDRAYLDELQGKVTGCQEEGEVIRLELIQYKDLWRHCPDAKTLSAMLLLERLVGEGKVKGAQ